MRSCGDCTACCTVMGVNEIGKPRYTKCEHLATDCSGCLIYDTRPKACKDFNCLWLEEENATLLGLTEKDRPDKIGMVMNATHHPRLGLIIYCHEIEEGAHEKYWGAKIIKRLKTKVLVGVVYKDSERKMYGNPARLRTAVDIIRQAEADLALGKGLPEDLRHNQPLENKP